MSIKKMTDVWELSEHKGSNLLLLLAIADFANEDGYAWPAIGTLAQRIRMSERHTRRIEKKLVKSGELFSYERPGKSNQYIVLVGTSKPSFLKVATEQLGMDFDEATKEWGELWDTPDKMSPPKEKTPDKMSGPSPDNLSPPESETPDKMSPPEGQTPDNLSPTPDIAMSDDPSITKDDPERNNGQVSSLLNAKVWEEIRGELKHQMDPRTFDTLLLQAIFEEADGDTLVLRVPNQRQADWINNRLTTVIGRTAAGWLEVDAVQVMAVTGDGDAS